MAAVTATHSIVSWRQFVRELAQLVILSEHSSGFPCDRAAALRDDKTK